MDNASLAALRHGLLPGALLGQIYLLSSEEAAIECVKNAGHESTRFD